MFNRLQTLQHPPRDLPLHEQLPRAGARAASPLARSVVCLRHRYLTDLATASGARLLSQVIQPPCIHGNGLDSLVSSYSSYQKKSRLSVYPCERWWHIPRRVSWRAVLCSREENADLESFIRASISHAMVSCCRLSLWHPAVLKMGQI